jgi:hypothetical protein
MYGLIACSVFSRPATFFVAKTQQWVDVNATVFADGSTQPPKLLRDDPEQNFLSTPTRTAGLALLTVALAFAAISACWVMMYRHHQVVLAGQPPFLLILCLGSATVASAIFPLSFDESHGWTEEELAKACCAMPWLICLVCTRVCPGRCAGPFLALWISFSHSFLNALYYCFTGLHGYIQCLVHKGTR